MKLTGIAITIVAILMWQLIGLVFARRSDKNGRYTSPTETAAVMAMGPLVWLLLVGVWTYESAADFLRRRRNRTAALKEQVGK